MVKHRESQHSHTRLQKGSKLKRLVQVVFGRPSLTPDFKSKSKSKSKSSTGSNEQEQQQEEEQEQEQGQGQEQEQEQWDK